MAPCDSHAKEEALATSFQGCKKLVNLVPGIGMVAVPSARGVPIELPFRDYLRRAEELFAQGTLVGKQAVAANDGMQIVSDNRAGPVFALLGTIAVIKGLDDLFVAAENRKPAEAESFKLEDVRFSTVRTS